jgi:hypothetical protein
VHSDTLKFSLDVTKKANIIAARVFYSSLTGLVPSIRKG